MNTSGVLRLVASSMIMLFLIVLISISAKYSPQFSLKPQVTTSAAYTLGTTIEDKKDMQIVQKHGHASSHEKQSKRIPDVLILGVKKCGTQTLGNKIILDIKCSVIYIKF